MMRKRALSLGNIELLLGHHLNPPARAQLSKDLGRIEAALSPGDLQLSDVNLGRTLSCDARVAQAYAGRVLSGPIPPRLPILPTLPTFDLLEGSSVIQPLTFGCVSTGGTCPILLSSFTPPLAGYYLKATLPKVDRAEAVRCCYDGCDNISEATPIAVESIVTLRMTTDVTTASLSPVVLHELEVGQTRDGLTNGYFIGPNDHFDCGDPVRNVWNCNPCYWGTNGCWPWCKNFCWETCDQPAVFYFDSAFLANNLWQQSIIPDLGQPIVLPLNISVNAQWRIVCADDYYGGRQHGQVHTLNQPWQTYLLLNFDTLSHYGVQLDPELLKDCLGGLAP